MQITQTKLNWIRRRARRLMVGYMLSRRVAVACAYEDYTWKSGGSA